MHLIIIQLQRQNPPVLVDFHVPKILAEFMFSIGRLHNDTHTKASNVSSFNRLLQSLLTQGLFENPRSRIVVLANLKIAIGAESKMHTQNYMSYWNLEVHARVPRLESSYVCTCKL